MALARRPVPASPAALFAAAGLVSAAWILLNAAKPFIIDDTFFLLWARTIHPLAGERPVTELGWEYQGETMHHQCENYTPGWALLIARARTAAGDVESRLHWLQWPFAVMFLAGAGLLARAFAAPPWTVVALAATSPLFLLPQASLMADVGWAGPAVFGLALWVSSRSWGPRLLAALLLVGAAQVKQTVLPLLPLLVLDRNLRLTRRPGDWLLALAVVAFAGWYPRVPPNEADDNNALAHVLGILSGTGSNPAHWTRLWREALLRSGYAAATLATLIVCPVAVGWAVLARPAAATPQARGRILVVGAAAILAGALLGCWKGFTVANGRVAPVPGSANTAWFYACLVAFGAWGWFGRATLRDRPTRWLVAWIALAVLGFAFGSPFPAARFLLAVVPPLAILFGLEVGRALPGWTAGPVLATAVLGNLWFAASLARSDYLFGVAGRDAAARGARVAAERRLPLVTSGSWGLRWYVERAGGRLLMRSTDRLEGGAVLLHPTMTNHWVLARVLRPRCRALATWDWPGAPWPWLPVRTVPAPRTSAAFHGGLCWFPYAWSRAPVERVRVLEVLPIRSPGGKRG